ncbi:MAG TPA: carboxypeptidase-like regulatory domain-containing protein [Bryobacteraceae bacterium]|nr:carboxypeptidase-like regulatory domain-containing protein [Bryobacteraceae bacterium]
MIAARGMLYLIALAIAFAQDQTGGIRGTVTDAATHQPVRRATISLQPARMMRRSTGPLSATSDAAGAFALDSIPVGEYLVAVTHREYPPAAADRKKIEVKPGEITSGLAFELIPGGAIGGRIVDEDGDPLTGCNVLVHPAQQPRNQSGFAQSDENGEYRVSRLTPGRYVVSANCFTLPFQPRPFSAGPDPPPSLAYAMQYYGGSTDPKTAETIEVAAGSEKPGIDFRMRPAAVTQIYGAFSPSGADWHGAGTIVQLYPADSVLPGPAVGGAPIDQQKGTFTLQRVFPGSYIIVAISNTSGKRNAALERIEVKDRPAQVVLTLAPGVDVSGSIQVESSDSSAKIALNQFNVQVTPELPVAGGGFSQIQEDGTFTLQSLLPIRYRLNVFGPAYVKSAWQGGRNLADKMFQGSAEPLRIVLGTNFATITGTAPPGENVFVRPVDDSVPFSAGAPADANGNFRISNVAPGKYRIFAAPGGAPPVQLDAKGQEVTVGEGETASVEVKPASDWR